MNTERMSVKQELRARIASLEAALAKVAVPKKELLERVAELEREVAMLKDANDVLRSNLTTLRATLDEKALDSDLSLGRPLP